ncbi:hypothetical protein [Aquabacterium sp.]|uniref:hypothetical protein n=1 Tax=Aquabacterium sp. TaxID=1872578 RepID=UPI002E326AAC|nr:hypothetical protein [Aquabacterium sp.]HEX5311515.1 hypothetical protein [Aquabacterium sp.]
MSQSHHAPTVTPALVTQKAVRRLPRWALLLFCAAYILPGLFGRDPWKNEDIASFGHMWSVALGQASWLHPNVGGVLPTSGGVLPYWLGSASILLFNGWLDPALAARIPFALLLTAVLALTWYTTFHLARTDAAQPLPLAFGGEAAPIDYARAVADGALLALIASLGLLQLGHETTPELLQLTGSTLFLYSLAAAQTRPWPARIATLASLPIMAASGSPTVALLLGLTGLVICGRSRHAEMRQHLVWVLGAWALSLILATALTQLDLPGWSWRVGSHFVLKDMVGLVIWFTWPTLPLAALTVWHWRRQTMRRHIAVPLLSAVVGFAAAVVMGANDRALLQALPALAVLAAFALPILQRGLGAALDWFSVFFFTICAAAIWLIYVAMHTGMPAKTAANVAKLVPGYQVQYSTLALVLGIAGTVAWLALVRWRTARHSHALWKSLVLPAGGVALCWLLFLTLWLPVLDQARSYRLLLSRVQAVVPASECIHAPGASVGLLTGLEYFGGYQVDGRPLGFNASSTLLNTGRACNIIVLRMSAHQPGPEMIGWTKVAQLNQRTRNSESVAIYRRRGGESH